MSRHRYRLWSAVALGLPMVATAGHAQDPSRCFSNPASCGMVAATPPAAEPVTRAAPPLRGAPPILPPRRDGSVAPAPPPVPSAGDPQDVGGSNADAARIAGGLPIDSTIRTLRDRLPPDVAGLKRQLGLTTPRAAGTDLRGGLPTKADILNALGPRVEATP